ncbi:MAG: hypothetical protein IKV75_05085 [Bacteroidales bacterium]|nr:hypothetical protein [Bacteroidales bacterium]
MLSILPAMIMCIPLSVNTTICMLIAFASGLSVDWLSEGLIGINAASLVPVALARKTLIRVILGEDMINRMDSFSIRKNGLGKILTLMIASGIIFLAVYITLDGAGTRPFWFCATRFWVSLLVNTGLAILVTNILSPDDRK